MATETVSTKPGTAEAGSAESGTAEAGSAEAGSTPAVPAEAGATPTGSTRKSTTEHPCSPLVNGDVANRFVTNLHI
jgi:hypothetical protein